MAISGDVNIRNALKYFYAKEGLENLLDRNDPLLKQIGSRMVEGKAQPFAVIDGTTPAVAGDYLEVFNLATSNPKTKEYYIEPGQAFSSYVVNAKELKASETMKGAYMPIAALKMFSSTEALRKVLASALYGEGYGELAKVGSAVAFTANTDATLTLPNSAIAVISEGMKLVVKPAIDSATVETTLVVKSANDQTITVTPDTTYTSAASDVICLAGCMDANGGPLLPVGLLSWLPIRNARTGATWNTYIAKDFFGVNRSSFSSRLAGSFYAPAAAEDKYVTIQKLMKKCRDQGSVMDFIVLNSDDALELQLEMESKYINYTNTATKQKRFNNFGISGFNANWMTNSVENIIDTPYLEKGVFIIGELDAVKKWQYTDADSKLKDGILDNDPGVQNPENGPADPDVKNNAGILLDNWLAVVPGTRTSDGIGSEVCLQIFEQIVVENTAHFGVGLFYQADYSGLLHY